MNHDSGVRITEINSLVCVDHGIKVTQPREKMGRFIVLRQWQVFRAEAERAVLETRHIICSFSPGTVFDNLRA